MDILSSIEVRWFIDDTGAEATAARAWFHDVAPQRTREDRYLLTERTDIGFKARVEEGSPAKLETKFLLGSLGPALLHERVVGHIDRWRKLSLEATDPELQAKGNWIRIAKTRRLRKFAYEGRVVRRIDVTDNPEAGCAVEMTELAFEIRGEERRAISVGLDAFGPDPLLLDVLLRCCPKAFESATGLGLELGFAQSESYPAWLARLVAGQG